jgi:hypothetical protein
MSLEVALQGGDRRAQLVRDIADELAPSPLRLLESAGHGVEALRHISKLVVTRDGYTFGIVAVGDTPAGDRQAPQWAADIIPAFEPPIIPPICTSKKRGAATPITTHRVATPTAITSAKARNSFPAQGPQSSSQSRIRMGRGRKTIADAANCLNQRCLRGVVAQFVAEVSHVHVDHMLVVVLGAPDAFQQLRSGEDSAGLVRQSEQQRKLARCQRNKRPSQRDFVAGLVDHQLTEGRWRGCLGWRPLGRARTPKHGPHPSHELPRTERLGEIVICADLEANDAIDLLGTRGEHQNVGVAELPNAAADLEAVEAWQHQI